MGSKKPGEMRLDAYHTYFFQEACAKARKEGMSRKDASALALAEFRRFKAYLTGDWFYCRIEVTLLDNEGEKTSIRNCLGGVESDNLDTPIQEMIELCKLEALAYKAEAKRFFQTLAKELV